MNLVKVQNYAEMSRLGAEIIHDAMMKNLSRGLPFRLGLATGNTMIELYRILAETLNHEEADLSLLTTWNLDEYAAGADRAVPHDHPLSYWKYMHENLFDRFAPARGFKEGNAHFPDPADPAKFDRELAGAGGLDLQLLGIGFNGHIAFNEPMEETEISADAFALLPTRVIALKERTIRANAALTAGGDLSLVPRFAATTGMKPILAAKELLLLACFPEQEEPLSAILARGTPTPFLPASYLLTHKKSQIVYTADVIRLKETSCASC